MAFPLRLWLPTNETATLQVFKKPVPSLSDFPSTSKDVIPPNAILTLAIRLQHTHHVLIQQLRQRNLPVGAECESGTPSASRHNRTEARRIQSPIAQIEALDCEFRGIANAVDRLIARAHGGNLPRIRDWIKGFNKAVVRVKAGQVRPTTGW